MIYDIKRNLLILVLALSAAFPLSGCSDDDEPTTLVPPQTTESSPVSVTLSLGTLKRSVSMEQPEGGTIKTHWEQGDKVYLNYTKTFSDDREIINVFTVESIDEANPSTAVFTCPAFVMPRGMEEGKWVYTGKNEAGTLSAMRPEAMNTGIQKQNGNNSFAHLGNYLYMESPYFQASTPEETGNATSVLRPAAAALTLQVKRPEHWTGTGVSEIELTLNSNNVTLVGTENNRITLMLDNASWNNDRILAHAAINMAGLVNDNDTWTVSVKESGTEHAFNVTFPAKYLEHGRHYSSLVSSVPGDYETVVGIEIPGFEDDGEAF